MITLIASVQPTRPAVVESAIRSTCSPPSGPTGPQFTGSTPGVAPEVGAGVAGRVVTWAAVVAGALAVVAGGGADAVPSAHAVTRVAARTRPAAASGERMSAEYPPGDHGSARAPRARSSR
ncbi:hypothetical protein BJF78_30920 [Pseudonocardia sp. CNS-139]|nr:hypothetical protein BJF78_30920 [Pseudonocardia sp. CNS-139]